MRTLTQALSALAAGLLVAAAGATSQLEPVGWIGGYHEFRFLVAQGDHLYTQSSNGSLQVFLLEEEPSLIWDGPLQGQYAAIGEFDDQVLFSVPGGVQPGVRFHSLRDPIGHDVVGRLDGIQPLRWLAVPPYLYFFAAEPWDGWLWVLDLSAPDRPRMAGKMQIWGEGYRIDRAGAHLAIVDDAGLRLVNISDPVRPSIMGTYRPEDPGSSHYDRWKLLSEGDLALLSDSNEWALSLDLSDPWTPIVLDDIAIDLSNAVELRGSLLFTRHQDGEEHSLRIYDLVDPRSPILLSTTSLPGRFQAWALRDDRLIGAGDGLIGLDVSDPAQPAISFVRPRGTAVDRVDPWGSHLLLQQPDRIVLLDVSDPTRTSVRSWVLGSQRVLATDGDCLYLAQNSTIQVVDASDPDHPIPGGVIGFQEDPTIGVAREGILYAVEQGTGLLRVVDARDPEQPRLEVSLPLGGRYHSMLVTDEALYVGLIKENYHDRSLSIFDLSDPTRPVPVPAVELGEPYKLKGVVNGILILHNGVDGIDLYDLSDPLRPEYLGVADFPRYAYDLQVEGDRMIGTSGNAVCVYDLSGLPEIVPTATYSTWYHFEQAVLPSTEEIWVFALRFGTDEWDLLALAPSPAPRTLLAGWERRDGEATLRAWTAHPGIQELELTWDGIGTGIILTPLGDGDHVLSLALPPGSEPGRYLLGLRGKGSNVWRPGWPGLWVD